MRQVFKHAVHVLVSQDGVVKTNILACGRYPRLFGEIAVAGADICTMRIEFMRLLYEHSFTEARMNAFLKSWRAVFGDRTWPELP